MPRVVVSKKIKASKDHVWRVIGDYNNIHVFHPFVERAVQINDISRGVGAIRQCDLYNKTSVSEEVIEWEEGQSFSVKNNDAPFVKDVVGGMSLKPSTSGFTEVTVYIRYSTKWGIAGQLFNTLLLKIIFKSVLNRVLISLNHYIQTGEQIGKGGKPISLAN